MKRSTIAITSFALAGLGVVITGEPLAILIALPIVLWLLTDAIWPIE